MQFDPDAAFQIASAIAASGWILLLASPLMPIWSQRLSGQVIPLLLAVGYCALVLAYWSRGEGGFDSLDNVAALFRSRELLLAGWVHYLAFDLFVGAWEARTARREAIAFVLVIPCLILTFLFGPVGLLLFSAIRFARRSGKAIEVEGMKP